MSSIKKYTEGYWKKFAETNKNAKNLTTVVDGKEVSIEQAIQSLADDTSSLKRNVAWLALHGGGGSGTGGGGSSSYTAKATLTVNANPSGAQFAIVNGSKLIVALNNAYPKNSTTSWKTTVKIGAWQKEYALSNSSPTKEIMYSEFASQLSDSSTTAVTVNATYNDTTNNISGSAVWVGYIYVASIQIAAQYSASYSTTEVEKDTTTIKITTKTPLTSPLSCKTTIHDGGTSYTKEFGEATEFGNTWILKLRDIFGYKGPGSWEVEPDASLYPVDITMTAEDSGTTITNTIQIQIKLTATDKISLSITGISKIQSAPTAISETTMGVTFTAEAFLDKATSYSLKAMYGTTVLWQTTSNFLYSSEQSSKTYKVYLSLNPTIFKAGSTYEIEFIASDNAKPDIVGISKNYVSIKESEDSYLSYDSVALNKQIVGIYAGTVPHGSNIDQFNTITPHMEISSDLPQVGTNKLSVDFNYINSASKVTLDDSFLNSLRVSNGTFFTIAPKVGSIDLKNEVKWTVGITMRSDKYLTDDDIQFLYGYYDGNNLIDGFVVKPHGIYWYNNSIEGGSKLIVNLTDETPNIIHFVYSNGSSNPEKWATTSNESFFKVYLNGVLSYIGNSCPFNTIKDTGKDTESITNINRFKMYVGGIDKGTGKFGNINVYSIEVFKGKLNEVGMVVSEANSKVMTNAVRDPQSATGWNVDFKKQDKELSANFCTKDIETKQISSLVYVSTGDASVDSSNYNFKTLYLGELSSLGPEYEKYSYAPPIDQDSYAQYSYQNEIKSIPFPIMFVDVTENAYWTFEEFTKPVPVASESDLYKNPCTEGKIWFWDPKKRDYAIYTTGVTVAIQGTSTLKDFVKNLNITMPKTDTTETLLFVNDNWIPENTYTLKADIVDSSHSNNASIGQFINTVCGVDDLKQTKGYDFSFDDKAIQNVLDSKEVLNSTIVDGENNPLLPNVTVKHTVEGFPVLLMMRYYGQENQEFKVLGIYSFNLGRDAVRNLGFKKITGLQLAEGETAFHALPAIAEYKVVEAATEPACWIERSTDGDIDLSVITDDSTTIPENINTGAASFWQSAAEIIDYDFETRYSTDKDTQGNYNTPSKHIVFTKFTETLQKLPIEGTIHYAEKLQQADIVGEYQKYKYDGAVVPDGNQRLTLLQNVDQTTIGNVNQDAIAKYIVLAMLFGLRDNFDKNISYRSWAGNACRPDFYDMDTALGLDNQGKETQSPMMLFKYLTNQNDSQNIPIARETFNPNNKPAEFADTIILPESVGNKILFSIDSKAMRTAFATDGSTSLLTTQWFRMRNEVEKLAKNAGYPCFIDWFIAKFFEKQTEACGSIFFNYDYKIKYINSFSDDDVISTTLGTYTKCHGRRIEYVRTWMTEHLAFLDSYFYWRGNCSFGGAETLYLKNGSSQVNRYLVYRHRNKTTAYQYTTMMSQYNSIIELFEDAKPLAPTFLVKNKETKVYIPKNGTDTGSGTASINHVNTLVSADWNRMQVASLTKSDNLSSLYNLNSFALNLKTTSQLDQSIFYDQDEISQLKSLNLSGYSSENGQVILDISPQKIGDDEVNVFKNVTEIDIHNSKSIKSLTLSDVPLRRLNVTSSLITSLKVENQPYINVPNINGCSVLNEVYINDCVLAQDEIDPLTSYVSYNIVEQENLSSLVIQKCSTLKSITLSACHNLKSVVLNECSGLTAVNIISCTSLVDKDLVQITNNKDLKQLTVSYCTDLSSFTFQHDSPSSVTTLNFYGSALEQLKLKVGSDEDYVEKTDGTYNVLDLREFSNASFSLGNNKKVKAIRFPNNKTKPIVLPQVGGWYYYNSNLRKVYGNIVMSGNGFSYTPCSLFSGDLTSKMKDFEGSYNQTLTVWENCGMQNMSWSDMNNMFEQVTVKISGKNYILPFLTKGADGSRFNDFDESEWARNYSFIGAPGFYGCSAMSLKDMNYTLFKIAVHNHFNPGYEVKALGELFRSTNLNGTLTNYAFKGLEAVTSMGWTFAGNRFSPQYLTKNMMSCIPNLNAYDYMFGGNQTRITCNYDTFHPTTQLTAIGPSNSEYEDVLYFNDYGNEGEIFKNCTQLKTIQRFNFENCDYGNLVFPTALSSIVNSFNGNTACVVDLPTMFKSGSQMKYINSSFNGSALSVIYRPSTFKNLHQLTSIGDVGSNGALTQAFYNAAAKRYIVKDKYNSATRGDNVEFNKNYIDDYLSSGTAGAKPVYNTTDWLEFEEKFLDEMRSLKTFNYALAKADITAMNDFGQYFGGTQITFPGKLFLDTTALENIPYGMYDFSHPYSLTESGFRNCTSLRKITSLFQQDLLDTGVKNAYGSNIMIVPPNVGVNPPNVGITSDIPYKLFYHGHTDTTTTLSGVEDFDIKPPTYGEVLSKSEEATAVSSFNLYKNALSSMALLNEKVFTALSTKFDTSHTWYNFLTRVDELSDTFKSVCYLDIGTGKVVVRSEAPYPNIYSTITAAVSKLSNETLITQNLYKDILDISSVTFTYQTFNTSIQSMDRCFYGNGNIRPYEGPDSSNTYEINADYHPFMYEYTGSAWKTVDEVDTFLSDDSWFYNGKVWTDDTQTTIAYNPEHKNVVDSTMSAMSFGGLEYTLSNWTGSGSQYKEKYCYAYNKDQCRKEMKYICAPDLLRYTKNDSTTEITGMFKATSNQNFDVDLGTHSSASEAMKTSTYLGIKGRIPPNLFKSLTNVQDLREFFRDCKYINGYLQTIVEDGVAKVVCKYIPDELFKYFGTNAYKLQYMFYNNVMPMAGFFNVDLDIATPFRNMTSTNLIYKDVSAIFARCQWLNSNKLTDAFKTVFLQKAIGAFSRRPVSGTYSSDGYLIPSRNYYGGDLGDTDFRGYEETRLAANQGTVTTKSGSSIELTTTLKIGKDNFEKNNFSGGSSTMKQFAVYADQVNVECNDFTGSFTHPFDW